MMASASKRVAGLSQLASGYQIFRASHPDILREVNRLRAYRDRQFARLSTLPGRDRHSLTRKLIRSAAIHRLYAFEGIRKAGELGATGVERIAVVASQCNPLQQCDEPSRAWYANTGTRRRLVRTYGPAKRGRQLMVADLLRHLHPPLEQQFLFRGGMPAAFRAVEAAYADGFIYGVEIDFVGFYGSVGLEGLAELLRPLPNSVVNHVVWDRAMDRDDVVDDTVPTYMRWAYPSSSDQLGIALGSACSPRVGERILSMLIAPTVDSRTVTYADNILVVGRTPQAVDECVRAMQLRASGFVGWSLEPRPRTEIRQLQSLGFEFLRHELRIEAGHFAWSPDYRRLAEFMLAAADSDIAAGPPTLDSLAESEIRIAHWRRAYPGWPDGDLWETTQLAALAAQRYYIAGSPLNRTNAATALIASYFANGRRQAFEELTPTGHSAQADRRRETLISTAQDRLILLARAGGVGSTAILPRD